MATSAPPARFVELDALRGFAAFGVMMFHFYLFWKWLDLPAPAWSGWVFDWSPVHILLTGKTTLFFFVLSGFVLSYPYFAGKPPAYVPFLIKRVIRIYVPYLVGVGFAVFLFAGTLVTDGQSPPEQTFGGMWQTLPSWELMLNHVLLVGHYHVHAFNAVIWSLVHEMRISIIIPLIVWCVVRFSWKINLALGLGLAVFGGVLHQIFHAPDEPLYKTLKFVIMFIVGALLAKNLPAILGWFRALPLWRKLAFSGGSLLLYTYASSLLRPEVVGNWLPADWVTTAGIAGLIVTALGSKRVSERLVNGLFKKVGEMAYGIYLYHLPILFFLYYLSAGRVPLWGIMGATVVLTAVMAVLTRHAVELPAARLAHQVATRYRELGRRKVAAD